MRTLFGAFILILLLSCSSDDSSNRNPFIPDVGFTFDINLNLPLFGGLNTPGNAIFIGNPGVGVRGIFVINTGSGFLAWEANCPNQAPSSCSTMELSGGVNVVCPCDNNEYSLFNGQLLTEPTEGERVFGLLNYATRVNGNIVIVSN